MKDSKGKKPDEVKETLDYQEPVLVRLDDRDKFQLGMCGVGVTGTDCVTGSGAPGGCVTGAGGK
jgi:hypothetical protein